MAERIPIGSDHAGFALKEQLINELRAEGYEPDDLGTHSAESTDYPDFAHAVASQVEHGEAARGILLCGTGLGMAYAANRHPGVRAAVAWIAGGGRARAVAQRCQRPRTAGTVRDAKQRECTILRTWLETPFEGGRHARRIAKIEQEPKPNA